MTQDVWNVMQYWKLHCTRWEDSVELYTTDALHYVCYVTLLPT